MKQVEICCGSYYDALQAQIGGARRIELNSALYLGGLTPTLATLIQVKKDTDLEVICMLRSRGGGFCFNEQDYLIMKQDCKLLLEHGADGIAFGFLNDNKDIDEDKTKEIVDLIHSYDKIAVFHRAFDCVNNQRKAIEQLISLGVNRILTSGGKSTVMEGIQMIRFLQQNYGHQIEILAGSGINPDNVQIILKQTNINQVHSSCKQWVLDSTSSTNDVSFGYDSSHLDCYDVVDPNIVSKLVKRVKELE